MNAMSNTAGENHQLSCGPRKLGNAIAGVLHFGRRECVLLKQINFGLLPLLPYLTTFTWLVLTWFCDGWGKSPTAVRFLCALHICVIHIWYFVSDHQACDDLHYLVYTVIVALPTFWPTWHYFTYPEMSGCKITLGLSVACQQSKRFKELQLWVILRRPSITV